MYVLFPLYNLSLLMQAEMSTIASASHKSLNLLERFLQNKNKYRQKYLTHIHQQQGSNHKPMNGQKPKTSAFGNRQWICRNYSSDNMQQEILRSSLLKRRKKIQVKEDNYSKEEFKQFILSERQKLKISQRKHQKSKKIQQCINYLDHDNIERELIIKKQARVSIVDFSKIPNFKDEPTFRSSAKQNIEASNRSPKLQSQKWEHYKKKKYIDSKYFSIKKFILNSTCEKETQQQLKKSCRNLSEIYSNRIKQDEIMPLQNQRLRHQQTEIIQIQPWDYDPNEY